MPNGSTQVRVRKSVNSLQPDGPELSWYAKAVAAMKAKTDATDPTSWTFQASVHGVTTALTTVEQKRFWAQCQHQSWYFLPWHRGYLAIFEEIVAKTIEGLGGPKDWALPYWNYSDSNNPNARLLPAAFVAQQTGSAQNPLWSPRGSNGADLGIGDDDVSLAALTKCKTFIGQNTGAHPGFGGPKSGFNHAGGPNGGLEMVPHNYIHDAVGGLMGDPRTAAHDPIFWLHHANIDRLWEVWLRRDTKHLNPTTDNGWMKGVSFELRDSAAAVFSFAPKDMLDTKAVRHGYQYDDVADPAHADAALMSQATLFNLIGSPAVPEATPQLVGASAGSVALDGGASTDVDLHPAAASAVAAAFAQPQPPRVFLNLENVTSADDARGSYEVLINNAGAKADQAPLKVGQLSLFGVAAASAPDGPHGGSGVTSVLEITEAVDQLRAAGRWDGKGLTVAFQKRRPERTPGAHPAVKVGRISVYFA